MADLNGVARYLGRDEAGFAKIRTLRLRRSLLAGVAGTALLTAIASAAHADDQSYDPATGTYTQSGGTMGGTVTAETYTQTGGTVTGPVNATNYDISGGSLSGPGTTTITSEFTLSGDGVVGKDAWLMAADPLPQDSDGNNISPTITQTGDDTVFDGRVAWVDDQGYTPDTNFTSYTLNSGLVGTDANIVTGDRFDQNGGTMEGIANTWTYTMTGGTMTGTSTAYVVDFHLSGDGDIQSGAQANFLHELTIDGGTFESGSEITIYPWGADNGHIVQTAGAMNGTAQAVTYDMSGGDMGGTAVVDVSAHFTLSGNATIEAGATIEKGDPRLDVDYEDGTPVDHSEIPSVNDFTQSGGTMNGTVTTDTYTQSGGALGGTVTTGTYDLTDAAATSSSGAAVNASTAFTLEPQSGTATVGAKLTGTGKLTKSGASTVVLTNAGNDFSGGVEIDAGTLQANNGALPATAAVTMSSDTTLALSIDQDLTSSFSGSITGAGATLVKDGAGTLNLGGTITLGQVDVDGGTLHVTNNTLGNTGSVDVGKDATLQMSVDSGKTVAFNNSLTGGDGAFVKDGAGTLTLGGAVYLGGLDVAGGTLNIGTGTSTDEASFESAVIESGATVYVAKNATLTIRIPNDIVNNGFLINDGTVNDDLANTSVFNNNNAYNANVASNTGTINNNTPGVWTGDILTNSAAINNNAGASWHGNVDANTGDISNRSTWTGDVNGNGTVGYWPTWTYGLIYNDVGATWTGNVVDNNGSIRNVTGTWDGNILDNHNDIMNDNSTGEVGIGHWNGDVVANHASIFNAGGGDWVGNVISNAGYIKSDRTSGYSFTDPSHTGIAEWHGNVDSNTGTIENRAYWYGDVVGNSSVIFDTGAWTGNVDVGNTGVIYNAEDAYNPNDTVRAAWIGNVNGNAGIIINRGADWTGDVEANTGTITNSGGIFNTVAVTNSRWHGNVVTNAGRINNSADSTWTGDVLANTGTITTLGVWNDALSNSVGFNNSLGGTVKAENQINGAFSNAGTLQLLGNLGGITTLTNTGLLDLRNGTTAGQTLTVTTASLQSGSTLAVSVDTAGNTDLLHVTGTATLGGAVQVTLNPIVGNYDYTKSYTIVTAGTVSGTFSGVSSDLAFLSPHLSYGTQHDVTLTLVRNQQSLADTGTTPNQKSAAAALDALGAGNPIYDAIVGLTADEADEAFDLLSGISQSSTETADMQAATLLSQILASRINQAFEAIGDGGNAVSNYAEGPAVVSDPASPTSGFWTQFYGGLGSIDGTATAAGSNATTGGFAIGLDGELGNWRLGVTVQAGTTETAVPSLDASSTSLDYGAGLYGGGQFGNTRLAFGGGYTRHSISSTRQVAFPGFNETLTGAYGGGTAQAFAQLSQEFDLGAFSFTPYADADYVANTTDAYSETGGAAALTHAASFIDATFTTLGVEAKHKAVVGDDILLTFDGGLGWRHTFAGTPTLAESFAGGTSFTVVGAPLPTDTAVVTAGVNLDLSATTTLDLTYSGQFGKGAQTHGLKASWNGKF